eukprot:TRINITY_DN3600_c0_g1_i2.p2 TRINITY_DN3600_c0_g1~~TRINITY_DN3600_c0_g1_i2.p2  ORF type:complete len:123 (-),score=4.17 TRINITY_DN3600_c0_g1_i2:81-449(-)
MVASPNFMSTFDAKQQLQLHNTPRPFFIHVTKIHNPSMKPPHLSYFPHKLPSFPFRPNHFSFLFFLHHPKTTHTTPSQSFHSWGGNTVLMGVGAGLAALYVIEPPPLMRLIRPSRYPPLEED